MGDILFSKAVLSKLRCIHCGHHHLTLDPLQIHCPSCHSVYPLLEGRFPDFLSKDQRETLEKELDFWNRQSTDTVYQDESDESYHRWSDLLQTSPSDEIIELGCGSGALLSRIPACLLVGLEPAINLLRATKGFWGIVGCVEKLPFQDCVFDLVYFKHSLHHLINKELGFKEAVRITRPGGRIVAIEPNANHPQRRLISNPKSVFRKWRLLVGIIDPIETFVSTTELKKFGRQFGVTCERVIYTYSLYDRPSFRQKLQKIYSFILRPFLSEKYLYPNYFISFRKPPS